MIQCKCFYRDEFNKIKISEIEINMTRKSSNKRQRHIIIGNSAAALNAIAAIRNNGSNWPITLISAEKHYAYSPVLLTYYLSKKISREETFLVGQDFYNDHEVDLVLGNRATKVDPDKQIVYLADGKKIDYNNLLIATGSSPKRLGFKGEDLEGVFTLKSIDDAEKILKVSRNMKEVVIVGGGLIGLQAANAIFSKDRKITMVIGSRQPLSQNIDPPCAESVCRSVKECGISLLFETNVVSIERIKNKLKIELNSGKTLDADSIIVGKGVTPNIQLVRESGIDVNRGIIVDETMRTNISNVFAAGDVAEGTNFITEKKQIIATWPNACLQGKTAGINMAGGKSKFYSLNSNICSFLGKTVASVGITKPDNMNFEENTFTNPGKGLYRKIVWNKKDEIIGALLMEKVEDIGVITNMIKNRVKIPRELRNCMVRSTVKYGDFFSRKTGCFLW